jgi:hypothetical protein
MKLSNRTVEILKNYSDINMSLFIEPGNILRTVSPSKTILASATVEEEFDNGFGIYDLKEFLGALSLIENPEVNLGDRSLTISSASSSLQYQYAAKELIVTPPAKDLPVPDSNVSFVLLREALKKVMNAARTLSLPNVVVKAGDGKISLQASDVKNTLGNVYNEIVSEEYGGPETESVFSVDNMRLMMLNYKVTIGDRYGSFVSEDSSLNYFIATEASK